MRAKEFISEPWRKEMKEQGVSADPGKMTDLPKLDKIPDVAPPESPGVLSKVGKVLEPVTSIAKKVAPWVGGYETARHLSKGDMPGAYLGASQMVPHPAVSIPAMAGDVIKSTQVDDPDSWLSQLPFRKLGPQGGETPVGQWATSNIVPGKQEVSGKITPAATPTAQAGAAVPKGEYEVKPGDSLSKIAARAGLNGWRDLYQKNIGVVGPNPDLIYPGQKLQIPKPSERTAQTTKAASSIRPGPNPNIDPETRQRARDWVKQQPQRTSTTEPSDQSMSSSGARYAADLNNPTGLGWNPRERTWQSFKTPEEGIAATRRQLSQYLSGQGYMKNVPPTPENVVSMWVTGGSTPAEKIQGGSYLQSVKNELAKSGIRLGPKGEIPNTPDATLAITRAMTKHETHPKHQEKFRAALYPESPTQVATRK